VNWRLVKWSALGLLLASSACVRRNRQSEDGTLTSIAQIRRLDSQSITAHLSARIRGRIAWVDGFRSLILQDSGGGIIVEHPKVEAELQVGQLIEVAGPITRAEPYPAMQGSTVILSNSSLEPPVAHKITAQDLDSLQWQFRYVEFEGIVRTADPVRGEQDVLGLFAFGRNMTVKIYFASGYDTSRLLDTRVRLRGILRLTVDASGQARGSELSVQSTTDLQVLEPAKDPVLLPVTTVAEIRSGTLPVHRIRLHGTVSRGGHEFVFTDSTGNIPLRPNGAHDLATGRALDIIAFAANDDGARSLTEAQQVAEAGASHQLTLHKVKEIQRLSMEELGRAHPAQIVGTVTYSDPSVRDTFVQDETGGIFVFSPSDGSLNLKVGQFVAISGLVGPGGFAPVIVEPKVRVLGTHPLPKPLHLDMEQVITGLADSQWIEGVGIARTATAELGHLRLNVTFGVHRFDVYVAGTTQIPNWLVNSRVRFRGVCGAVTNFRGQLLGVQVSVPDISFIQPESAMLSDRLPLLHFDQLLQYSSDANFDLRSRTRGTVVFSHATGPTYLRDDVGAGLLIKTHAQTELKPGDLVEAVGSTRIGDFAPFLEDAQLSKLASLQPPKPIRLTAEEVISSGADSQFIEIDGFLVNDASGAGEQTLILQAGDRLFQTHLGDGKLPPITKGALLRVRGITAQQVRYLDQFLFPVGFSLTLRSPADVTVLRNAPWWTAERMLYLVTGGVALILAAMTWIMVLRRRVRLQTADLRSAKEAAEDASRTKGEFLANMSHEIRTPMNGVLGMTQLALETNLTDDQREYISVAKQSADALLTVINDVLDFSKIEAGKLDLDPIPFALREKLADDVRTMAMRAQEKNLELIYEIDDAVPDNLVGDPGRLRQIVLNLISNAVKFTLQGEVALSVTLESQSTESVVLHFTVRDTGIGIPAEKRDLVFAAFSQADSSTTRRFGGTGLGLSISKQLVAMMNGKIWLESVVGQGSCFHFTAEFGIGSASSEAVPLPSFSKLSVLIVDDHPATRRILSQTLSKRGATTATAESAAAALELLEHQSFDFAILDAQMPEVGGFALAQNIQKRWSDRPMKIIMLTEIGNRASAKKFLDASIAAYLSKPVKVSDLFKILCKLSSPQSMEAEVRSVRGQDTLPQNAAKVLRILVADDNLVNQKVAKRMLERLGHSVTLARDGGEAVNAVQTLPLDLVMMDVQMPTMDGLEATKCIRTWEAGRAHIPIIALTAHAMASQRDECLAAGMDSFLTKPILFDALKLEIERVKFENTSPTESNIFSHG
jgi:signal transduction histidine kinase/DNA-binding response OmpR family regulator